MGCWSKFSVCFCNPKGRACGCHRHPKMWVYIKVHVNMKFWFYNWTLVTKTLLRKVFSLFLRNDSKFPCHIGCAYLAHVHVSVLKEIPLLREKGFFLPKANYTMKNPLNSLRPFFKFAKFSFGAESQWSILKNLIQKMACSLRHQKLPMFFSFIRKNFFYRSFDEV